MNLIICFLSAVHKSMGNIFNILTARRRAMQKKERRRSFPICMTTLMCLIAKIAKWHCDWIDFTPQTCQKWCVDVGWKHHIHKHMNAIWQNIFIFSESTMPLLLRNCMKLLLPYHNALRYLSLFTEKAYIFQLAVDLICLYATVKRDTHGSVNAFPMLQDVLLSVVLRYITIIHELFHFAIGWMDE